MYLEKHQNVSVHFTWKKRKDETCFIWKVYMIDKRTHVDPQLLNDIMWGLKALCDDWDFEAASTWRESPFLKWLQMSLCVSKKSIKVIQNNLKSIKSWGNKSSYNINMQRSLSFFVGSQTQCGIRAQIQNWDNFHTVSFSTEKRGIWHI